MESEERDKIPNTIAIPASNGWPMIAALGLTMAFAGLVTSAVVSAVGAVLIIAGAVGWFEEVFPKELLEAVTVEPAAAAVAIAPVRVAVAKLEVGEEGHRAALPLEIYPYSAGIKGGIAGGFVMAALAAGFGLLMHGSVWYPINILAATAIPSVATLSVAALSAFNLRIFIMAVIIHGGVSLLVGLLYGVLLPLLPRNPILFGGVIAPLLWTGLLYSSLKVINPLLDARIEWASFIVCQIGFGLTAGFVVASSEKIRTFQHLPFAMRMGVEAPGVMPRREH